MTEPSWSLFTNISNLAGGEMPGSLTAWATAQDPRSPGAAPLTQQQAAGLPGPAGTTPPAPRSLEMSPSSDEDQGGKGHPRTAGRAILLTASSHRVRGRLQPQQEKHRKKSPK